MRLLPTARGQAGFQDVRRCTPVPDAFGLRIRIGYFLRPYDVCVDTATLGRIVITDNPEPPVNGKVDIGHRFWWLQGLSFRKKQPDASISINKGQSAFKPTTTSSESTLGSLRGEDESVSTKDQNPQTETSG